MKPTILRILVALLLVALFMGACSRLSQPQTAVSTVKNSPPTEQLATQQPTLPKPSPTPERTATITLMNIDSTLEATSLPAPASATPLPTLAPGAWMELPVIPEVSPLMRQVYQKGLELGNNSRAFSKVGDCGSTPAWFLGDFDNGPGYYKLGDYSYLEAVIQEFQGSFGRTSLAAKAGFNASSVFSPLWSNPKLCQSDEGPLACEYRLQRPAFALITLGTNDKWHQGTFEEQMRKIIEYSLDQGIVPILATKPDNLEGDGSINETIARLAQEYQAPLWNYWKAVQDLPDGGLQEDGAHITWAPNRFSDPQAMQAGWPVRNLTALQVLEAVWSSVTTP